MTPKFQIGQWLYYGAERDKRPSVVEVVGYGKPQYCERECMYLVAPRITKTGKPVPKGTSKYRVSADWLRDKL